MRVDYQEFLNIKAEHEYWNHSSPDLFDYEWTTETNEWFRKFSIEIRKIGNVFTLLIPEANRSKLHEANAVLTLLLKQRDYRLKNITAIENTRDNQVIYFSHLPDSSRLSAGSVIPIKRQLLMPNEDHSKLINNQGFSMLQLISTNEKDPSFTRHINTLPEGIYSDNTHPFFYQSKLVKNLFGVIEIKCQNLEIPANLSMPLKSKRIYIQYRVQSKNHDVQNLDIKDLDEKTLFEPAVLNENEIAFTSNQPLALHEKSPYQFNLFNGSKKAIKENLPISNNTHNLKCKDQLPDHLLNEIFIHV